MEEGRATATDSEKEAMVSDNFLWWQRGIVYQVYPRSFQDTNADGVGDLVGITRRLDYLRWLGVDAVWISPIYPSPMADFGYDVSDYTGIHPLFGTLEDFDTLVQEAHARDLKVILDFVPNHSSIQHPWFQESRASRENPKRDWYIWKDPAPDGGPPNNWLSNFGGPAWTLDPHTGQYYYHAFLKEQPDLNWRNPEVESAMLDVLRFWLDRGVDGFRVDVIWHLIKDEHFRDNPPNPDWRPLEQGEHERLIPAFSADQPDVHDIVGAMRRVFDEYDERVMIGEVYLPIGRLVTYYGQDQKGAHLPFNFQLITLPWDAQEIFANISRYEGSLPPHGWPNWVLGNHDNLRIASRVGPAQARIAAMLLLTLRGTPTMYYGDEIGMQDVLVPPERVQDPQEKNEPGKGLGRDPERTPMQWDTSPNAGFTTGTSWLPIADDFGRVNVETERADPDSMLSLYRRLIDLRQSEPALRVGSYAPVTAKETVLAYVREASDRTFLVAVNLGHGPGVIEPQRWWSRGRVVLGTNRGREGERIEGRVELHGNEGVVVLVDGAKEE